jgi:hypothetical protein
VPSIAGRRAALYNAHQAGNRMGESTSPHNRVNRHQPKKGRGMPSGKDSGGSRRSGTGRKNAACSFCGKSYRDVGPLVEGPKDAYICGECIELCQSILDQ